MTDGHTDVIAELPALAELIKGFIETVRKFILIFIPCFIVLYFTAFFTRDTHYRCYNYGSPVYFSLSYVYKVIFGHISDDFMCKAVITTKIKQ